MHRIRVRHRLAMSLAVLVGCGGLLAASVAGAATPARAQAHKRHQCSPIKNGSAPRILTPCAGATISVAHNHNFTIVVYDPSSLAYKYKPFLYIAKTANPQKGRNGIDVEMKARRGHHDEFIYDTKSLPDYNYPGFWRVTSGTYHIQVVQVGGENSLNETLHFRA